MWRAVTVSVLLVALAAPAGADAACAEKGDKTIARNSQAVLVQTPAKPHHGYEVDYYACLAGSSERIDVTDHSTTSAVTTPVLAGHFVALHAYVFPSPDDEAQSMDLVDLRRGDEHFSAAFGPCFTDCDNFPSFVVTPRGTVGFIEYPGTGKTLEVRVCEYVTCFRKNKAPRLLDRGKHVDKRSLRLSGGRMTWRNGSRTRSAKLR